MLTGTAVTAVEQGGDGPGAVLLADGRRLDADAVLVAAGRRPDTSGLGLDAAGVGVDDGGAVVGRRSPAHDELADLGRR